ncbi:MAG: ABC transporter substrate-binding protein, partial [Alicyclobacillaceae bacterium]|nr:ABC transporter substrate-binding protein [Alicyclobacillaceae bacterium]
MLQPELADKVTVSEDGKTYTLHLRQGVKWHDGRPFTAQDVLFTYEAILDPQVDSPYRPLFLVDGKRPQMRAVDDNTVEIQLPHPSAGFANALTVGILPKHAFSKVEDVKDPHFNEHPIGTGPFAFYQWKSGQSIELKRFDDYFAGKPGVDKLIYRIVPESGLQSAFSNGTIDVYAPTATDILKLRENQSPDRPSLFSYPSGSVVTLLLHDRGSPLADRAVRKALALAIDRKEISVKGWGGSDLAEPAHSLFPPGNWAHGDAPPPA